MKLNNITEEETDILQQIARQVSGNVFTESQVRKLVPHHSFIKKMEIQGHVMRVEKVQRAYRWQIREKTLTKLMDGV